MLQERNGICLDKEVVCGTEITSYFWRGVVVNVWKAAVCRILVPTVDQLVANRQERRVCVTGRQCQKGESLWEGSKMSWVAYNTC